jgi:arabinofuranosyltransferase
MVLKKTSEPLYVVACAALFVLLCVIAFVPAEEDAFIYYRYALNFAQGNGLVFNPNEWVEGYSSAPWMGALVLLAAVKLDLPAAAPALSIFFGTATIFLAYWLAAQMRLTPYARLSTCTIITLFYPFLLWSKSGLETSFYTAALTAASALYLSTQHHDHNAPNGRHHGTTAAIFIVCLARPEGILFAAVIALDRWLDGRDLAGARKYLGPVLLGYCVLLIVRYQFYASLSPNTSIKFNPYNFTNGLYQVASYVLYLSLLPFIYPILTLSIKNLATADEKRRDRFLLLTVLLVSFFFTAASGGDYRDHYRFLVPTFPLVVVLFTASAQKLATAQKSRFLTQAILWVSLAAVMAPSLRSLIGNLAQNDVWRQSLREWRDPLQNEENYHAIAARWILEHIPSNRVVAFGQMGKAPYYALHAGKDLVFVDMLGLTDATLAGILGWQNKATTFLPLLTSDRPLAETYAVGRERIYNQALDYFLNARRPDVFIIEAAFLENPLIQALLSHPQFRQTYVLKTKIPNAATALFLVYEIDT